MPWVDTDTFNAQNGFQTLHLLTCFTFTVTLLRKQPLSPSLDILQIFEAGRQASL